MEAKTIKKIITSLYILTVIAAASLATQFIAAKLDYQEALYWVIYSGEDFKLYFPFAFLAWKGSYYDEAPRLFIQAFGIFGITTVFVGTMLVFIRLMFGKKTTDNYGSARWATEEELEKSDLYNGKGIFLGIMPSGNYVRDDAYTHTFLCAPSRSGKGVGIIIPTLLYWPHSVVVTDVKGENWAFTAGRRKEMGQVVIKFDPTNLNYQDENGNYSYDASSGSAKFNPFDEIRMGTPQEVEDAQNICRILVDPTGRGFEGNDKHWVSNAADLLFGIVLHLKYDREYVNISTVLDFLAEDNDGLQAHLFKILEDQEYSHDKTGKILRFSSRRNEDIYFHPSVRQIFVKMTSTPDKEFGSIQSTLETALSVYRDPIIAENMSSSDFTINDLMDHEKPVSLYLIIPPSDIDRMMPVFRLIVELMYRRNTEKMDFDVSSKKTVERRNRLLLLLDEFPALGKLGTLEKGMGVFAGYGIKAFIICQSVLQINQIYGKDNGIISNCEVRVFYAPNDSETPKYLSGLMGKKTVETKSFSSSNALVTVDRKSVSYNETGRELMTPDEISSMDRSKAIVLKTGMRPILCNKITWYNNPDFMELPKDAPEISDKIAHDFDWKSKTKEKLDIDDADQQVIDESEILKNDDFTISTIVDEKELFDVED